VGVGGGAKSESIHTFLGLSLKEKKILIVAWDAMRGGE
jgi:hypothetical protein